MGSSFPAVPVIAACAVILTIPACGSSPSATDDAGVTPSDGASVPATFAAVCLPCHGADAAGTKLGPEIKHPPRDLASWVVRNGRAGTGFPGPMAGYAPGAISDAALAAVLDWLTALPRAQDGQGLYLDFCGNCHGADGLGGIVGQRPAGKPVAQILAKVRTGHGGAGFANRTQYMPKLTPADLSDAELEAIESFLGAR